MMSKEEMLALLAELLSKHAPSGDESEIEPLIRRELEAAGGDRVNIWPDDASNMYAHLPGEGPKVMICAHKDEIGMIVTDVLDDGRLKVRNIGGSYPWKYGEGPVDILTDDGETLRAILSVGSVHTVSGPVAELMRDKALTWDKVTLFTGLTPDELKAQGVHVGSRAVVARERKALQHIGDYIASYALDDRMGVVSLIAAVGEVVKMSLPLDLYFVVTTSEEIGLLGAIHAAQHIRPDICIALDTAPVTDDVPAEVSGQPIVWYGEAVFNDKKTSDRLLQLADELGFGAQPVIYSRAASDAGGVKREGLTDISATFGFPRDNSHGFEIAHPDSLVNVTRLLIAYLEQL